MAKIAKLEIQVDQETLKMLLGKISTQESMINSLNARVSVLESKQ